MSKLFIEKVLDKDRLEVLDKLKPFLKDFPIHGGTGLALYFGHRISFDFDLFGGSLLKNSFSKNVFATIKPSNIEVNTEDELTFFTQNNVKITFLYYPFESLEKSYEEDGIFVASLPDLIANKFYTIGRRGEIRDYVDVYFILQKYSLEECLDLAERKYSDSFNKKILLGQLAYFNDLNFDDPTFSYTKISQEEFKKFFEKKILDFTAKTNY